MEKKRPLGRPSLPPDQARSKSLLVKMTPSEHSAIMALAQQQGKPAGQIMREYALRLARRAGIDDGSRPDSTNRRQASERRSDG